MGNAAAVAPPPVEPDPFVAAAGNERRVLRFRFQSLVLTEPQSLAKGRTATLTLSIVLHAVLILAAILVPLFWEEVLPAPDEAVRAFFVSPPDVAPPPPPPPPPAPAGARTARPPAERARPAEPPRFTAPIDVPTEIKPDEAIDLGVEGGMPGGIEGGVPGGVVGGIVGGLPTEAPPPPKAVRIGGNLKAPRVVHKVNPEFPPLALMARIQGMVILEALVDARGYVRSVTVLRSAPLFDDAAIAAVKQWRYQPLLLNGEPTDFILTVTLFFNLTNPSREQ